MALTEIPTTQTNGRRSIRDVRIAGLASVAKLREAERLRAEAVAGLVEFDAINGHITEGYLTPQRQLIDAAGLTETEANRMICLVTFCTAHPQVAHQLNQGLITIDHADALMQLAKHVDADEFAAALGDLLHAATGVDFAVFRDRIRTWRWRTQPEATEEDLDTAHNNRSLTTQRGLFGGMKGQFELDPAAAAVIENALTTTPDPVDSIDGPRTLAQRKADRLVELAALANQIDHDLAIADPNDEPTPASPSGRGCHQPNGARQQTRSSVDVIIDLPTLLGTNFDLNNHRDADGNVDWESIEASFALTASAPRPVMQQFFCDASWRTLITSGGSIVLDYTHAKPEISPSQRRAVQRRDRHCQFQGCDRHWTWCDVHHLRAKEHGGWDLFDNLTLVCRRHHTMLHQQHWQLWRDTDGRIQTTTT